MSKVLKFPNAIKKHTSSFTLCTVKFGDENYVGTPGPNELRVAFCCFVGRPSQEELEVIAMENRIDVGKLKVVRWNIEEIED